MKNKYKRVGTSFEDKNETTLTGRGLYPWEQKVVDERTGKKKFHGAFTGGFSAGYKNTCGSEGGFVPSSFVSSRSSRSIVKQEITDFMDNEDLGEISLSKSLKANDESIGEKIYENMRSNPLKRQEYGPTMPPEQDLAPKQDYFGLGFDSKLHSALVSSGNIIRPSDLFRSSKDIYEDELNSFEKTIVDENTEEKPADISLTTELQGFTLGLSLEYKPKYPAPALPPGYNPKDYLLSLRPIKKLPKKKAELDSTPLCSNVINSAEIEGLKRMKKFVKSCDSGKITNVISKDLVFFPNDSAKNTRCFNFICKKEGLEIGGIAEAQLMTASQIKKEHEEFMIMYKEWKSKAEPHKPVEAPNTSITRTYKPWRPSKELCYCFKLPQPQVNVIESKPFSKFYEHILPVIKSSVATEPLQLPEDLFSDLQSFPDFSEEIGLKRHRNN